MKYLLLFIPLLLMGCYATNPIHKGRVVELYERNEMHFVDITLNGIKTKLLIDTGASKSLLDISQAETYGFEFVLLSKNQYVGLGGFQDIYVTYGFKVDEFYIPFLGTDLSEVQNYFIRDDINIVGVLGSDFLEKHKVSIDFNSNKLYIR